MENGESTYCNDTSQTVWYKLTLDHSAWVEVNEGRRLYRPLVEEGFIHHASLIHGDQTQALLQACKFLDIQPVLVE